MGVEVKGAGDGVVIAEREGVHLSGVYSFFRFNHLKLLRSWDWINLNNSKNYAK